MGRRWIQAVRFGRNPFTRRHATGDVDAVEIRTTVHLPPAEVHEFLVNFTGYADYSEHLEDVRREGDGGPGTEYELDFTWWRLTYTARSRVTAVDAPERIDWEVLKDVDAAGHWAVAEAPEAAPADAETASRVRFRVEYRPESADPDVDLPALASLDWLVEKVRPKVEAEARRVVERIVADLEGERRDVDLEIEVESG